MLIKMVRHRRVFLVSVFVLAVLLGVAGELGGETVSAVAVLVLLLLALILFVVTLVSFNALQPSTFLIRDGAFTTTPGISAVALGGLVTVVPVTLTFQALDANWDVGPVQILILVVIWLLYPVHWYGLLGNFGIRLRPDGLLDRKVLGSVFIPWEAGLSATPTRAGVKLAVSRPDLVTRRGFRPGLAILTGADRGYTAWSINLFATRPDLRPAIGTQAGLPPAL